MKIDQELLKAALAGYQSQLDEIDAKVAEIRGQIGSGAPSAPSSAPETGRRKMSASARRRIGEAQKKRWAEFHKGHEALAKKRPGAPRKKRKMSAAGRKRIIEATKKRWAAYRAQKASR